MTAEALSAEAQLAPQDSQKQSDTDFFGGIWDSVEGLGESLAGLVTDPAGTAEAMWYNITHPVETLKDVIAWDLWVSGEGDRALGQILGGVLLGGGVGKLAKGLLRPRDLPPARPSWRGTETDVGAELTGRGYRPQVSFRNGEEVPYGTKGSVRPDYYKPGSSVEVKNYTVTTPQGQSALVSSVSSQARSRAANLPPGSNQSVVIDVRGQDVPDATLDDISSRIVARSGGAISQSDITFKR